MGGVVLAVEVDAAVLEDGFEDLEVFAQVGEGGVEWEAHSFDGGAVAGAYAEAEAAGGELGDDLGLLRHYEGVAGVGGDDGGAEFDVLGEGGGGGKDGDAVGAGAAGGHPGGGDAQFLGAQDHGLDFADGGAAYGYSYQFIGHVAPRLGEWGIAGVRKARRVGRVKGMGRRMAMGVYGMGAAVLWYSEVRLRDGRMDDSGRPPVWGFVDGAISVSGSMLLAALVNACDSCGGIWLIGYIKGLSDKDAGLIVVATLLLFPTAVVTYGGLRMWFAAKEAVEKKAMERGHQAERERIGRLLSQALARRGIALPEEEIDQILADKPAPSPPARPYRRRSRRGGNGR